MLSPLKQRAPMKKIIAATLSACALATMLSATDTSPIYNNQTALETKKLMMLSQLLTTDLDITASGEMRPVDGKRGFFASMSENTDKDWEGFASVMVQINNCYSQEQLEKDEKFGYTYISRTADTTVVAYREAVKQLKENGAKYVTFPALDTGKSFAEVFQEMLTRETIIDNNDLRVLLPDGKLTNAWRTMDGRCFQDNSLTTKNVLWGIAKVATLAIGLRGATTGNTSHLALSSSSEQALGSHSPDGGVAIDYTKVSGVATRNSVSLYGSVYKDHFAGKKGYVFPITEVEEHLAHYKVIPYKMKEYL